jgi:hypothetical protein
MSNSNFPAHQSQESASKPSSPAPGAAPAGAASAPAGSARTHPDSQIAQDAKAVGGGLEAGSTDFGPDTKAMEGGRTTAGAGDSRSTSGRTGNAAAETSPAAAGGNSVLNTGRPTQGDSRSAIGAAPLPGKSNPDVEDPAARAVGQSTRAAADPSGIGTLGGGTAGRPTSNPKQRTTDVTEGRTAPTEGARPGTEDLNFDDAARGTPQTPKDISRGKP